MIMPNKDSSAPLVSIVVITYNSVKFILETLESAKLQTYENLELIVSDDASSDDTRTIVGDWISQNQDRFVKVRMVTTDHNQGTSKNLIRGIGSSHGEWIKIIAGDDILMPDCIADSLSFAVAGNCQFVTARMIYFNEAGILDRSDLRPEQRRFFSKDIPGKLKSYIRNPVFLNIPSMFFSRDLYEKADGYDDEFFLLEDQPFIFRVLMKGFDIQYLDKPTVKYRIHSGSVTGGGKEKFIRDTFKSYVKYREPFLDKKNFTDLLFRIYIEFDFKLKLKGYLRKPFYRAFNRAAVCIRMFS